MCYPKGYEETSFCASLERRRAPAVGGGLALVQCLRPFGKLRAGSAPLPGPGVQRQREMAPQIARHLGCNDQTVRNAIGAFNHAGLASLSKGSSRPPTTRAAFPGEKAEQLRALLHQSPRTFHQPTNLWTPELAAEVSFQQGLTPRGSVERPSGPPWPAWGCAGSGPKGGSPAPTQHMAEKRGSRPADPPGSHPP
jgi:hypothetical protein